MIRRILSWVLDYRWSMGRARSFSPEQGISLIAKRQKPRTLSVNWTSHNSQGTYFSKRCFRFSTATSDPVVPLFYEDSEDANLAVLWSIEGKVSKCTQWVVKYLDSLPLLSPPHNRIKATGGRKLGPSLHIYLPQIRMSVIIGSLWPSEPTLTTHHEGSCVFLTQAHLPL